MTAPPVRIDVRGKALELIAVEGNRHSAQVDGERRRIRSRRTWRQVSEAGAGYEPPERAWVESETADIAALLKCLAGNAKRTTIERGISLLLDVEGAHFRQSEATRVSISIAADGAVEIDTVISTQDDSYY